ncbi:MAG: hypothetical protein OEZ06_17845 [Myxococcales bacterium]|nr:hypothetical protein [Myxococcales bacterium]
MDASITDLQWAVELPAGRLAPDYRAHGGAEVDALIARIQRNAQDVTAIEALQANYREHGDFPSLANLLAGRAALESGSAAVGHFLEAARAVMLGSGNESHALELCEAALRIDPAHIEALRMVDTLLALRGDYSRAQAWLQLSEQALARRGAERELHRVQKRLGRVRRLHDSVRPAPMVESPRPVRRESPAAPVTSTRSARASSPPLRPLRDATGSGPHHPRRRSPPSSPSANRTSPRAALVEASELSADNGRARLEVNLGATTDSNLYVGFSEEIARGGVYAATYENHPLGAELSLELTLPGGFAVPARGVVRFARNADDGSDEAPGLGIQFVALSQDGLQLLERFASHREPMFQTL